MTVKEHCDRCDIVMEGNPLALPIEIDVDPFFCKLILRKKDRDKQSHLCPKCLLSRVREYLEKKEYEQCLDDLTPVSKPPKNT